MRQELELAKAELQQSATRAGKGAGMLGGAAVAGYFVLLFASIALWWAIGSATGLGWSAVIVAVIWGIVGAVLYAAGRNSLKSVRGHADNRGHREENPGSPQGQRITPPVANPMIASPFQNEDAQ